MFKKIIRVIINGFSSRIDLEAIGSIEEQSSSEKDNEIKK